jgi:hypothetical protein
VCGATPVEMVERLGARSQGKDKAISTSTLRHPSPSTICVAKNSIRSFLEVTQLLALQGYSIYVMDITGVP